MVLLLRIPFFRLPLTCCKDEEISSVVFLLTCFSSRCASRGTILITNVPQELLSIDEALVLARCRWQIELCWKLWKQVGKVDTWRSAKPYRILTEIYAKLLGCLITRLPHA